MVPVDRWSLARGENDGKPVTFRIRNQAPSFARKVDFPHLLAASWRYESPDDQGMPAAGVAESMAQFEERLVAALEGACQAFLAVIVTGDAGCEWQWYARDSEEAMKLLNEALGDLAPFPVQFGLLEDPEWEGYAGYLAIIGSQA